jgi:hypothetical protein
MIFASNIIIHFFDTMIQLFQPGIKNKASGQALWLMTVISATWEAEIRRTVV